jgi:hypothetical protein
MLGVFALIRALTDETQESSPPSPARILTRRVRQVVARVLEKCVGFRDVRGQFCKIILRLCYLLGGSFT